MTQATTTPVQVTRNADATRSVAYYGHEVGHFARVRYLTTGARAWRGVTVRGAVVYASTERAVTRALMAEYRP